MSLGWFLLFLMMWIPFKLITSLVHPQRARKYRLWEDKVYARWDELYLGGMFASDAYLQALQEFKDEKSGPLGVTDDPLVKALMAKAGEGRYDLSPALAIMPSLSARCRTHVG